MSISPQRAIETVNSSQFERSFPTTYLMLNSVYSLEQTLWAKEDVYDPALDSCEVSELIFEDGLEEGSNYHYDPQGLLTRYPLSVQEHLGKCLRCQSRLVELIQRYQRTWLSGENGELDKLIEGYITSLNIYPKAEFELFHATLQSSLGSAFLSRYKQQANPEDLQHAQHCYEAAVELYRQKNARLELAGTLNNLANVRLELAAQPDASEPHLIEEILEWYQGVLKLFKQEDFYLHQALVHNNIANAQLQNFERSNEPEKLRQAFSHYQLALEFCQSPYYPLHYALLRRNLGTAWLKQYQLNKRFSDWQKAFTCYRKSAEFFAQNPELSFDLALTSQTLAWLEKIKPVQRYLTTQTVHLDNLDLTDPSSFYQSNSNYNLGVMRLAGLIEVRATLSWNLQPAQPPKMAFDADGGVMMDGWRVSISLQPLLLRSSRLRLRLTLPATQEHSQTKQPHSPSYPEWTSRWYTMHGTDPLLIDIPAFGHLLQSPDLHWQIEETDPSNLSDWSSSYLTWSSLVNKLNLNSQHSRYNLGINSVAQWLWSDTRTKADSRAGSDPEIEITNPKTVFDLMNLTEHGLLLALEGEQISADQLRLTLQLLSVGVMADSYSDQLKQTYEVSLVDHEGQTLLPPSRLKIGQHLSVEVNLPLQQELETGFGLEFKLRLDDLV